MKAVTRALAPGRPLDPVALVGDDGVLFASEAITLAGSGRALVVSLRQGLGAPGSWRDVETALAAIDIDDEIGRPGTGPVALGALPFESQAPGTMVVPSLLYGRTADGTEWVTVVGDRPPGTLSREWLAAHVPPRRREHGVVAEIVDCQPADYPDAVRKATQAIAQGAVRKVVLARRLVIETAQPVRPSAMLARLTDDEPFCTAFLVGGANGTFLGASPELLVSRRDRVVVSHPLAGTVALNGARPERSRLLLDSAKDLEEHELVVADIAGVLDPLCSELVVPGQPSLVPLRTMAHLGTRIEGRLLAEGGHVPCVLELVAALHPTPAVGGVPRDDALSLITALEPGPRGCWAGPLGWMDAAGDGDWVVGLRSATLAGAAATVWAGAGIVAASDPEAEQAEVGVKLAPVLEGLSPGSSTLLRETVRP